MFTELNLGIKNKNESVLQYNHKIFDISSNISMAKKKISSFNNIILPGVDCPVCGAIFFDPWTWYVRRKNDNFKMYT